MIVNELSQLLIEFGLTYLIFFAFAIIGNFFLKKFGTEYFSSIMSYYGRLFTSFFCGLLIVIYLYSVIVTKGLTINLLLLPVFYYLFVGNNKRVMIKGTERLRVREMPYLEVGLITLIVLVILHLFPESEYKQADSFFYLKIAESLNATGQENVSHYSNIYNSNFHGMEPYHYFEIWITAFIIRMTQGFFPSINVERFVRHAIILTALIVGLYYLAEGILKQKIDVIKKIFCWSLLFILPNFLFFSSYLYKFFISDFEGNVLERPNFRIIYLILIPIILKLYNSRPLKGRITYLLLFACIVSFQCAVVILPSIVLFNCYSIFILKEKKAAFNWLHLSVFCVLFATIYLLFPVNKLPTFYATNGTSFIAQTLHGWKFILFSICTSAVYILIIVAIFLMPLFIADKEELGIVLKKSIKKFQFLLLMSIVGLVIARVLYLKDNAYQFLFIAHIIATFFIWLIYLLMINKINTRRSFLIASVFLSIFWFAKPLFISGSFVNTFKQNGNYVYNGKKYSSQYLKQVSDYFKDQKDVVGGYIADTNFYKNTYYSRRNPNVYFLPITYILSSSRNNNFEFCLSDTSAIMYLEDNKVYKDYVTNAYQRSFFYQYRIKNPSVEYLGAVNNFINTYHLSYLFVTKDYSISSDLLSKVKRQIIDTATGEKCLVFQ